MSVYSPRSYQDVVEIADSLRSRQVVIVNLQNADRTLLQRVVDFTSGVAYTIDGKIQKLAESIYLVVPAGVVVNAAGLRDSIDGGRHFRFHDEQTVGYEAWKRSHRSTSSTRASRRRCRDTTAPRSMRFLDEIIETLEDEAQHRAALEAEIADLKERISHFKAMEESLQNTLVLAQRTADEVKASAHKEADLIREQARLAGEREIAGYNDAIAEVRREHQRAIEPPRRRAASCAAC